MIKKILGLLCIWLVFVNTASAYSYDVRGGNVTISGNVTLSQINTGTISGFQNTILPQAWVDPHQCDHTFTGPETKTIPGDYTASQTGLNTAINDWVTSGVDEWRLIKVTHGTVLTGSVQINVGAKTGATKCLVIDSDTPNTTGVVVCSHGWTDFDGSARNYGCATGTDLSKMWTLESSGTGTTAAIDFASSSNHVVFKNMEARHLASNTVEQTELISIGHNDGTQTTTAQAPNVIGIMYSYIHGFDNGFPGTVGAVTTAIRHTVHMACKNCWVQYNYWDQLRSVGNESHCIITDNGPGPILINRNYMECGSHDLFISGGSVETIPGLVTSDVEIDQNMLSRSMTYCPVTAGNPGGSSGTNVKASVETKSSARVLLAFNYMQNVCVDGQAGFAILINVRACSSGGTCTGTTHHVTLDWYIQGNIIRNVNQFMQNDPRSDSSGAGQGVALPQQRMTLIDNIVYNMGDHSVLGGSGSVQFYQCCTSGNTFVANAVRSSGTVTLTLTSINVGAVLQSGMTTGDHIYVQGCTDTTFQTPTVLNSGLGAQISSSVPTGTTVQYPNAGPDASTTCTSVKNHQGWGNSILVQHNSMIATGQGIYGGAVPDGFQIHFRWIDNIQLVTTATGGGSSGGFKFSGVGEGTASEGRFDLNTFWFNHSIISLRTASSYTEYPSGLLCTNVSATCWFPSSNVCATGTADTTCPGMVGMMNGVPYELNAADWHDYALHSTSLYKAGGSRQASDGGPVGARLGNIDTGDSATVYTCPASCGSGPFNH
jgi:hypothetical protein